MPNPAAIAAKEVVKILARLGYLTGSPNDITDARKIAERIIEKAFWNPAWVEQGTEAAALANAFCGVQKITRE
jgi:hypothetical protein